MLGIEGVLRRYYLFESRPTLIFFGVQVGSESWVLGYYPGLFVSDT